MGGWVSVSGPPGLQTSTLLFEPNTTDCSAISAANSRVGLWLQTSDSAAIPEAWGWSSKRRVTVSLLPFSTPLDGKQYLKEYTCIDCYEFSRLCPLFAA